MAVIAIDGTFASGKGTLGKKLAGHYGIPYMDTGKLYRAVAAKVLKIKISPENIFKVADIARKIDISNLDDPYLRSAEVGVMSAMVSPIPEVRKALLSFQRDFAEKGGILDGRDIGTVICPDADVKFYVDADEAVRATRRHSELRSNGEQIDFKTVLSQLRDRDSRDANRKTAPMKMADDAHRIDTTSMGIGQVFRAACKIVDPVFMPTLDLENNIGDTQEPPTFFRRQKR